MSDVQDRLDHPDNLCNKLVEFRPLHGGGKSVGDVNLPAPLRTLIASAALISSQESVAKTFDLSQQGVSKILAKEVEEGRVESKSDKIRDKALDTLASLFETAITAEKLGGMKPRDAVSAAKDLAAVVDRVTPKNGNGPKATFVVFSPRVRSEEEYEVIDVDARRVP